LTVWRKDIANDSAPVAQAGEACSAGWFQAAPGQDAGQMLTVNASGFKRAIL
jgi:hypothetical protein